MNETQETQTGDAGEASKISCNKNFQGMAQDHQPASQRTFYLGGKTADLCYNCVLDARQNAGESADFTDGLDDFHTESFESLFLNLAALRDFAYKVKMLRAEQPEKDWRVEVEDADYRLRGALRRAEGLYTIGKYSQLVRSFEF